MLAGHDARPPLSGPRALPPGLRRPSFGIRHDQRHRALALLTARPPLGADQEQAVDGNPQTFFARLKIPQIPWLHDHQGATPAAFRHSDPPPGCRPATPPTTAPTHQPQAGRQPNPFHEDTSPDTQPRHGAPSMSPSLGALSNAPQHDSARAGHQGLKDSVARMCLWWRHEEPGQLAVSASRALRRWRCPA